MKREHVSTLWWVVMLLCLAYAIRAVRNIAYTEGWLTGYYDAHTGGAPSRPPLLIVPDPAPTPGTARPVFSGVSEVAP